MYLSCKNIGKLLNSPGLIPLYSISARPCLSATQFDYLKGEAVLELNCTLGGFY